MKAQHAATQVLEHICGHVTALRSQPPKPANNSQRLGSCGAVWLLKGIIALEQAGMGTLAGILARQHWETWLVSLYVLLAGDEALQVVAGDDISWKRRLSKVLRLEREYHPDWAGKIAKLNLQGVVRARS